MFIMCLSCLVISNFQSYTSKAFQITLIPFDIGLNGTPNLEPAYSLLYLPASKPLTNKLQKANQEHTKYAISSVMEFRVT